MKILVTLLFCLLSLVSFGQSDTEVKRIEIDQRLYQVYSSEYLEKLQETNPFLLQRWNFYLDNAYYITDKPKDKDMEYKKVIIEDIENMNILLVEKEQKLHHDFRKQMYYQIEGTEKILVYYSGEKFKDALNEHLDRKYTSKD